MPSQGVEHLHRLVPVALVSGLAVLLAADTDPHPPDAAALVETSRPLRSALLLLLRALAGTHDLQPSRVRLGIASATRNVPASCTAGQPGGRSHPLAIS